MTVQRKELKFIACAFFVIAICLNGCSQNRTNNDFRDSTESTSLIALSTVDMYENGEIFETAPDKLRDDFLAYVDTSDIPDARSGERTVGIHEEGWDKSPIVFLASNPDEGLYLYGYNDPEHPGYGLIIDYGEKQTIYPVNCWYMTTTTLPPDIIVVNNELIAIILHSVNGTGVSVDDIYILHRGKEIDPYHLDIASIVDSLNQSISMETSSNEENARIYWNDIFVTEDSFTVIGLEPDAKTAVTSFYVGNKIAYKAADSSGILLNFVPQLYTSDGVGSAFLNHISCLQAPIEFSLDSTGAIEGYVIGVPAIITF